MIVMPNKEPDKLYTGSKAQAQLLVNECAKTLQKHYPYHMWHVDMSADLSIINIRCLNVDGQYGYVLHTLETQNDPDLKCIMRAGGEILERAFKERGKNDGSWADKLDLNGVTRKRLVDKNNTIKVL